MAETDVESYFPYDSVVVNYELSSIRSEYDPDTFLPKKLKPRGGKAKNSLFEEIDENLYEPEARMIAFHTKLERILPWIKTLDIFYEFLGESDKYNVTWYDEPPEWVQSDTSTSKCVVIELLSKASDKQNSLLYKVKFFVTTGTLQVQGNEKDLFSKYHFKVLKNILSRVLDAADGCTTSVSEETIPKEIVLDDPQVLTNKSPIYELDNSNKSNRAEADFSTIISKLEDTFVQAVKSLSQSQSDIIKSSVKEVEEKLGASLSKLARSDKDKDERNVESLKEKIRALEEDKRLLNQELHFQKQRNASEVSHMKTLLSQKDSNFEQEKRNIMALLDQEKTMRVNLQEQFATLLAQEKQIHGNLQKQFVTLLADTNKKGDNQVVPDSLPATVAPSAVENEKPSVLLVGTSNIAKINETKITNAAKVSKIVKYTIDDTKDIINEYEDSPDVVVFHPLTNDIKTKATDECVSLMKDLTDQVEEKWPDSKIIISLATPRNDSNLLQINTQVVNALLKKEYMDNSKITISDNDNMLLNGQPNEQFLDKTDRYHLSDQGVSKLAANIKNSIHEVLSISVSDAEKSLQRSQRPYKPPYRQGRGRARFQRY